jgi:hypothetical protein
MTSGEEKVNPYQTPAAPCEHQPAIAPPNDFMDREVGREAGYRDCFHMVCHKLRVWTPAN